MSDQAKQPGKAASIAPASGATETGHGTAGKAVPYLSVEQRIQLGKAARKECTRETHAGFAPAANRPNPVDLLEAQAATRVPELVPIRYGRMLISPFAFFRGAAAIMAADLASLPHTGLKVQLCGDAHLSNFGGFASPEREFILDINDFDETLPGPWDWDVKRLAASLEIAGRERNFSLKDRRSLVLGAVGEYRRAMEEFAAMRNLDFWYLHLSPPTIESRWGKLAKPRTIRALDADFAKAPHRDNLRAFEKLTHQVNGQLKIVANPPGIVPIDDLASAAEIDDIFGKMVNLIHTYRATLLPDRRRLLESYRYVHAARKIVGVGSVGTRTWVILLLGRDDNDPLFLQAKEAQASVLEPYLAKSAFADHGKRVVEGQWAMQSSSDIFLGWVRAPMGLDHQSHDFYVRQLWDWKISADVEVMLLDELLVYGKMCGWMLARAHARTGDRIAIAAYLGKSAAFEQALAEFAAAYADQNERDYQALVAAARSGRIKVQSGV